MALRACHFCRKFYAEKHINRVDGVENEKYFICYYCAYEDFVWTELCHGCGEIWSWTRGAICSCGRLVCKLCVHEHNLGDYAEKRCDQCLGYPRFNQT